ncbi:MAG: sulfotransferase domain-containing protein [archaeon]
MKIKKMGAGKIRKPNLFLVGVARAGTSSWTSHLNQHPEILMSREQRPNFFGEYEDNNSRYFNTEEKYLSLFKEAKNEKFLGDSSHVFGSLNAPKQIKQFNKNSKIIIILRSPIDILRSNIDAGGYNDVKELVFTLRELLYYENLKRWITFFGKKNVHIILFDDYIKDIEKEYKKVCDFLEIDNKFKPNFRNVHYSAKTNYSLFMKAIFYAYNKIPFTTRLKIKEILGGNKKKIQKFYRKVDNARQIQTIIKPSDKKLLQRAFFLKEIEKTEKLINKKLDIWKY